MFRQCENKNAMSLGMANWLAAASGVAELDISGHLSLLSSMGWEISAGQEAVMVLSGWEGEHRSGRHHTVNPLMHKVAKMVSARSPWRQNWKPWVRPVWRRTPLFYVTILATLCTKRLMHHRVCGVSICKLSSQRKDDVHSPSAPIAWLPYVWCGLAVEIIAASFSIQVGWYVVAYCWC